MKFLFSQLVGPDIESCQWGKILKLGESILMSRDIDEGNINYEALMKSIIAQIRSACGVEQGTYSLKA